MKFSGLRFEGAVLHMTIQNTLNSPVVGGETTLHTEGYGCFFFLCDWVEGPAMTNSTCDYTALECSSEVRKVFRAFVFRHCSSQFLAFAFTFVVNITLITEFS